MRRALALLVVAACSVKPVTFTPGDDAQDPVDAPARVERCDVPGDEDGNGLADCADPACTGTPGCQVTRGPACGDGTMDPGEACDDGNLIDGDGCDSNCTHTGCGNGIMTAGEACDDGNLIDGDGCDHNCKPTGCGNGIVTTGEQCDDGNLTSGDGCDNNCKPTGCGNGIVTAGEGLRRRQPGQRRWLQRGLRARDHRGRAQRGRLAVDRRRQPGQRLRDRAGQRPVRGPGDHHRAAEPRG